MNTQAPVIEKTVIETPVVEEESAEKAAGAATEVKAERTWSEEIELTGNEIVQTIKELIAEGNVRRLILRTPDNGLILEIPLMAGAVVGGVLTVFAPLLVVVGALASVFAQVKVEIVRVEEPTPKA
jgi:hypothetical protein